MHNLVFPSVPLLTLLVLTLMAAPVATVLAQESSCGNARVIIEGGEPSPYILPDNADTTLKMKPETVLQVRAENLPTNSMFRINVHGLGMTVSREIGPVSSSPVSFDLSEYSQYVRGVFEIDGALLMGQAEICSASFRAAVSEFGGVVAQAAAAATAVTGAGAVAGAAYAGSGAHARLKLKVKVERRRPRGWRRWVPVPAWRRIITGSIIGTVTGLGGTVLLQQAGTTPLSIPTVMWGMVTGGGVTFGIGLSLGVLMTFLRPPVEE